MAESRETKRVQVSFVCQKCCQPLRLDPSFAALDDQMLSELSAPLVTASTDDATCKNVLQPGEDTDGNENISRKRIVGRFSSSDSGNDFTLIGETGSTSIYGENLSHRLKVTSHLFDIISGHSDIDHPLCEECTDSLLDQMDQQLQITQDECKDYREFLGRLQEANSDDCDVDSLEKELEKLKAEEKELHEKLQEVDHKNTELTTQIEKEKSEAKQLDNLEKKYWREYGEYKRRLLEYEDEQRSVENQLRYAQAQQKLKKTNVFNATFHIWYSGHFGTINNFRLGRLPNVPVEWNEINAAWGQTVLLLHSLAKKTNLTFQRYRLVPYGNHSYVESLTDKSKELPLYGSGGFRFFWDTKFDQAMVAFLDCLQQFQEEVDKSDSSFRLPYRMEKGKIEDTATNSSYSIKIQFNSEEQWTKALKFMLTNLKWGLAWVSSQFADK